MSYILFLSFATLTGEENKEGWSFPCIRALAGTLHFVLALLINLVTDTWSTTPRASIWVELLQHHPSQQPSSLDSCIHVLRSLHMLVSYLKNKLCNNHLQSKCLKARITYSHSCVRSHMECDRPRLGLYGVAFCIWLDPHLLPVSLLFVLTGYPIHVLLMAICRSTEGWMET